MMGQIIDNLYVGDIKDAYDHQDGFVNLNVALEHVGRLPKALSIIWFRPVQDGTALAGAYILQDVLNYAADFIDWALKTGHAVLVNCNMGAERAPLTVVWFLMKKRGMSLDDAYDLVKKGRPQTQDRRLWIEK